MELDSVHERVFVYRPGVRRATTHRLAIGLAGASDILLVDRREGDKLDGVDLNLTETDPVAAALLDTRPPPQSD